MANHRLDRRDPRAVRNFGGMKVPSRKYLFERTVRPLRKGFIPYQTEQKEA